MQKNMDFYKKQQELKVRPPPDFYMASFRFANDEGKSRKVQLRGNNMLASNYSNEYGKVFGDFIFEKNEQRQKYFYAVQLSNTDEQIAAAIGVCRPEVKKDKSGLPLMNLPNTWTLYTENGQVYHKGVGSQLCDKLKKGDWIGVELNMQEGTLNFSINGGTTKNGFMVPDQFKVGRFVPCISLYKAEVRIVNQ